MMSEMMEINHTSEQEAALRVLKTVVPCSVRSKHKEKTSFRNTTELRYDPTTDVSQNDTKPKPSAMRTKKKSNRVEPSSTSEASVTVPETKFFEVAPSLKSVFDRAETTFSLFGSSAEATDEATANDNDDDDDDDDINCAAEDKERLAELNNKQIRHDSSHEMDSTDEESESVVEDSQQQPMSVSDDKQRQTFFISTDDLTITESLKFFSKKSEVSDIRDKWSEKRLDLIRAYRQRHKDSLRRRNSTKQRQPQRRKT